MAPNLQVPLAMEYVEHEDLVAPKRMNGEYFSLISFEWQFCNFLLEKKIYLLSMQEHIQRQNT